MRRLGVLSAVLMLLLLVPAAQAAQVLANGSFEIGDDPGSYTGLSAGSTSITGWDIGVGGVDYIGTYWAAADGVRSIDLNADAAGSIYQTFGTVAGATYAVTFMMAGNPDGGTGVTLHLATSAGNAIALRDFTVPGSSTTTNMNWEERSYSFQAQSDETTINFFSLEIGGWGPALDYVRVEGEAPNGVGVPEPSTLLLLGSGLLGIVVIRRKKII